MNVVPFLCPMALNLHQKRPSPVTFGWLFHRAIRHEIAAPSFVLMRAGAAKLPPSSVIPPRHTTRKRSAIIRFDGDGAAKLPRHPPFHRTIRRETVAPSFVLMAMVQGNYPLGGYTFFNSPHPFPAFGNSVARRGSRLRVAFACIVGENSVKEKWTIDDFRHP